jgi:hypothetical protein
VPQKSSFAAVFTVPHVAHGENPLASKGRGDLDAASQRVFNRREHPIDGGFVVARIEVLVRVDESDGDHSSRA